MLRVRVTGREAGMSVRGVTVNEALQRARGGDQKAFVALAGRYHPMMIALAEAFVPSRAAAEQVARDTWLGVLRGIDRPDERAPLKTWLCRLLVSRTRTAGERQRRVPA